MPQITSFGPDLTVLVVGGSGGIGGALLEILSHEPAVARLHGWSRRPSAKPSGPAPFEAAAVDITDEDQVAAAARALGETVHLTIVAAGILHAEDGLAPEKSLSAVDAAALERVFRVNTVGPALVAKHVIPLLPRRGKGLFAALSARVGSIGDNRLGGWYAYRASKAALNMILRNVAIEVARRRKEAVVVGLHPGTVATDLSAPFQGNVSSEKLFSADLSAGYLLDVVDGLTPEDTGAVFAWDGQRVEP
ncbi:MAG: SDR family NAD(P)-dependent oxidoreductase [Alphaproteobacteria bacterium]